MRKSLTPRTARIVSASLQNTFVDIARAAWVATVLACLVAGLILLLEHYFGYAVVTFAVAASAAINLLD